MSQRSAFVAVCSFQVVSGGRCSCTVVEEVSFVVWYVRRTSGLCGLIGKSLIQKKLE